ncbi:hypothetical protein HC251_04420 [Iamia sp. SCSIO 61187]|uniref:hypothetical protein n=1 Tax=Iamia sp. SCSIO 61187 TaxID=2722752 RepID=UPI001C62DD5E|nr:hypothetical protein [Iamia sp. SCSIO 61187]QYG91758.1 hypothetical protein HC251_04420 [Iamia sp. SCSIO 61187]
MDTVPTLWRRNEKRPRPADEAAGLLEQAGGSRLTVDGLRRFGVLAMESYPSIPGSDRTGYAMIALVRSSH